MTNEPQIDVQVGELSADEAADVPDADWLAGWVQAALSGNHEAVTVRIVGPAEIQALNRDYRDADKPTNVLSFPAGPIEGLPPEESGPLGDIVICADVVSREAGEQGKALTDHWAHMLVHGTLHLLGYDHMTDVEAAEMEQLEIRILADGGVGNPYVSR
ncbi:MAG: rRNA maturation RNase YbeY [Woeseiaceae bacterium]|nr:rRNA maturation RNase YbeY [Woeseiaceae bacterium]